MITEIHRSTPETTELFNAIRTEFPEAETLGCCPTDDGRERSESGVGWWHPDNPCDLAGTPAYVRVLPPPNDNPTVEELRDQLLSITASTDGWVDVLMFQSHSEIWSLCVEHGDLLLRSQGSWGRQARVAIVEATDPAGITAEVRRFINAASEHDASAGHYVTWPGHPNTPPNHRTTWCTDAARSTHGPHA